MLSSFARAIEGHLVKKKNGCYLGKNVEIIGFFYFNYEFLYEWKVFFEVISVYVNNLDERILL